MAEQHYIPLNLAEKTLSRLPFKSLMRFKCVSKEWDLLFSDSKFIKTHQLLSRTSIESDNNNLFLCSNSGAAGSLWEFRIDSDFEGCGILRAEAVKSEFPLMSPTDSVRHIAHCDGLLCILGPRHNRKVLVWNPLTKKYKRHDPPPRVNEWGGFGFSRDSTSDDYKFVLVAAWESRGFLCLCLKTGMWKAIESNTSYLIRSPHRTATAFNGCLYWIAEKEVNFNFRRVILCFNLERDEIREEETVCPDNALGLLGGSLCVTHCASDSTDVWVKKEEGWTELMTIPFRNKGSWSVAAKIIGSMGNGKILVSANPMLTLSLYDPKDGSLTSINKIATDKGDFSFKWTTMIPYTRSLVSPG